MNYPTELQQKMAAAGNYNNESIVAAAGRPSNEIEGCLSRANNALERLHGRISAVEDRLRPVMRGVGSGHSGTSGKPQEAMSPLGDAIAGMESRMDSACDRLEALLLGLAL